MFCVISSLEVDRCVARCSTTSSDVPTSEHDLKYYGSFLWGFIEEDQLGETKQIEIRREV